MGLSSCFGYAGFCKVIIAVAQRCFEKNMQAEGDSLLKLSACGSNLAGGEGQLKH
jgi:hypothetical protein